MYSLQQRPQSLPRWSPEVAAMLAELQLLLDSSPELDIRLHDVYCPSGVGDSDDELAESVDGVGMMSTWVQWVISGSEGDAPNDDRGVRHWVLDEMQGLWQRWLNTMDHSHTTASLSEVPTPAAVSYTGERRRPDLAPLHDALVAAGTDGWRPMTAMRVGLMECLAVSSE